LAGKLLENFLTNFEKEERRFSPRAVKLGASIPQKKAAACERISDRMQFWLSMTAPAYSATPHLFGRHIEPVDFLRLHLWKKRQQDCDYQSARSSRLIMEDT